MKRIVFPVLLVLGLFVTFLSCSSTSDKRPRKPVSNIVIQPVKQRYVIGEKVSLNIETKLRDGELKTVKVYRGNELLKESKELEIKLNEVELNEVGVVTFNVHAEKTDGLNNSRTKPITVVSDIEPAQLTYQVVNNYPHSTTSFTQGLEFHNGNLYEGTGELGHSKLMKVELFSGKALKTYQLPDHYFGEGITILADKVYQLTYRAKKGFVYDLESFALIDSFTFASTEGWGLTNDGKNLIMSDGTHILTWLDPNNFSVVKKLQVADNKGLLINLNELEFVEGVIYANIWTTNKIVKINASNGKVLEEIDLSGLIDLYHKENERIDYLNGIAWDEKSGRMFVTGKLYPRIFEVKFIEKQ